MNTSLTRRSLMVGLGATAALLPSWLERGQTQTLTTPATKKIRVAWLRSLTPLVLSKIKGSLQTALAPQGFEVEWVGPFPAFSPAVEAINAKGADLTVGSSTSASAALAGGAAIKIFAYADIDDRGEGIVVKKEGPIRAVKDLVGKKVAVNRGGTGEYLLVKALEKNNIPVNQVERVYLGPADAASVFAAGQVDAWAVWGTFLATAEAVNNGRLLASGVEIGSQNDIIYAVRTGFLQENPAVVKTVFEVLKQETTFSRGNRPAAIELYRKEFQLPDPVWQILSQRFDGEIRAVGSNEVGLLKDVATWFYDQKVIPSNPDINQFVVDVTCI